LATADDLICSDELNHASIVDGCRLSSAHVTVYRHLDMTHLEQLLRRPVKGKKMVVTDSIFSMEGTVAPLDEIVRLAREHNGSVLLDEAHATGVLGPGGEGSAAYFGLETGPEILIGTLGKALGSVGGFVAGSRDLITYIAQRARPFIFTTSLPPASVAAALCALRILRAEPLLVQKLWTNATRLHAGLRAIGFRLLPNPRPINPVFVGNDRIANQLRNALLKSGVLVQAVNSPYVASAESRLRTIVSAAHSEEDIDRALSAFADAARLVPLALG
jgi:7-keto-8-aminopelargonate synthetase-like enzyme